MRSTLKPWKRRFAYEKIAVALGLLLVLAGCGPEEPKSTYSVLGVQDYSHGSVGKFSARVVVQEDLPREMVRIIIREVVANVVEDQRADICWVVVHTGEPATMNNLLASAQWVSPSLPPEERPFIEVSEDATPYSGAPIYITWP